jgi:hypothetical protein
VLFLSLVSCPFCDVLSWNTHEHEVTLSGRGIIFSATIIEAWCDVEGEE